jgi:energy-coupling factor transporter transmembrane protein EcfT
MNIVTQLIGFLLLAISLNLLPLWLLSTLFTCILLCMVAYHHHQYFRLLKRLKWFFVVTILLFVFNTPGEHLAYWPFAISPSYEGLQAAMTQVLRLALMLAVISHILLVNTREQLIAGMYFLLYPLHYLQLDIKRFAARLWLTLHYVEIAQNQSNAMQNLQKKLTLFERFDQLTHIQLDSMDAQANEIQLDLPSWTWIDVFALALMLAGLIVFMLGKLT